MMKQVAAVITAILIVMSSPVHATWVYTCEPPDQGERTWTLSNDQSGTCDGGSGSWVEINGLFDQSVDSDQVDDLIAAIIFVLIVAFSIRVIRKTFGSKT